MYEIDCPWCGLRDESEFHCTGEAHIIRPEDPYALDDAQWTDYLHHRSNPKGLHFEQWQHTSGCRKWFNVARDTVTYEIKAVYKVDEPKPAFLFAEGETTVQSDQSNVENGAENSVESSEVNA